MTTATTTIIIMIVVITMTTTLRIMIRIITIILHCQALLLLHGHARSRCLRVPARSMQAWHFPRLYGNSYRNLGMNL